MRGKMHYCWNNSIQLFEAFLKIHHHALLVPLFRMFFKYFIKISFILLSTYPSNSGKNIFNRFITMIIETTWSHFLCKSSNKNFLMKIWNNIWLTWHSLLTSLKLCHYNLCVYYNGGDEWMFRLCNLLLYHFHLLNLCLYNPIERK